MEVADRLERRVLAFIRSHGLVSGPTRVVAGVSGGPDSVCLLYILFALREELDITIHVAHLNHGLRGAEAEQDADYVAGLARILGLPATIERRDVQTYKEKNRMSLEEAAREVRYDFLASTAGAVGASVLAVGHTTDDNVETILLHLVRGTGTRGLRGLQPATKLLTNQGELRVVRPLLELSREDTENYCMEKSLAPRIDASNLSLSPLRNRIRHQLLPLLRGYNTGIARALLRTSSIAADELDFIERQVACVRGDLSKKDEGVIRFDREKLRLLHPALQRELLRSSVGELLGSLKDVEARHIEDMMGLLEKPAGKEIRLPGGLVFSTEYDTYRLGPAVKPFPELSGESALKVPGETTLPGWIVKAEVNEPGTGIGSFFPKGERGEGKYEAFFDFERISRPLAIRSRHPGDRFQPQGMGQLKRLSRFMTDAKVPREERAWVPIITAGDQIIWVVGWRIDERFKVSPETRRVLVLRVRRAGE